MKLALLVKYVGTSFEGFQAQPSGNTVQQHMTRAASEFFGFPCNITGCSRTDSGVHAMGFVCTVYPTDPKIAESDWCTVPPARFHRAIAPYLHRDIAVIGAASVPDSFHPRYDAVGKEYVYLMNDSPAADPFLSGRVWKLMRPVTDEALSRASEASAALVGRHDFRAFMANGSSVTDTVRAISDISLKRESDGLIRLAVTADGFLYNMVRIITGTLVSIAYGAENRITEALGNGRREILGMTAPPEGLYLNRVIYKDPPDFKCI